MPAELLPEVRAHRAEIVAALSRRQVPADAGLRSLLERLRRDQAWLTEHCDTHLAGLEAEGPYVASLMAWGRARKAPAPSLRLSGVCQRKWELPAGCARVLYPLRN